MKETSKTPGQILWESTVEEMKRDGIDPGERWANASEEDRAKMERVAKDFVDAMNGTK